MQFDAKICSILGNIFFQVRNRKKQNPNIENDSLILFNINWWHRLAEKKLLYMWEREKNKTKILKMTQDCNWSQTSWKKSCYMNLWHQLIIFKFPTKFQRLQKSVLIFIFSFFDRLKLANRALTSSWKC